MYRNHLKYQIQSWEDDGGSVITHKICSKCNNNVTLYLFGRNGQCSLCLKQASKIYRENNRDKIIEKGKKYSLENKEKEKERRKKYREKNKDMMRMKSNEYNTRPEVKQRRHEQYIEQSQNEDFKRRRREYYQNNKELWKNAQKERYEKNKTKILQQTKEWAKNNPEARRKIARRYYDTHIEQKAAYAKEYVNKNREKVRENIREYKRKISKNPFVRINNRMSKQIRNSLVRGKEGKSWKDLVPYTLEELFLHLSKKLRPDMTWQDFMDGKIHIEHVRPAASFQFKSYLDKEFKECWALSNLSLEWGILNQRKGDRLINGMTLRQAKKQNLDINAIYEKNHKNN